MPDLVMHHHLGRVVYSALPEEIKKAIQNVDLYDFATAGPDPFFFYHFFNRKLQKESKDFGDLMHRHHTKDFFVKMIEISKVDYNMFNYLCGFVTHYYLDSLAHPYVFYKTGVYKPEDPSTLVYRGLHTKLERAMDSHIIQVYYDSNPNSFKIYKKILGLKKLPKSSKESFDRLYSNVYGINDGFKYVNQTVKWQRRFYKVIYDPFGLKNKLLTKKDDGTSPLDLSVLSYYNKSIKEEGIDIFNFKHKEWSNPVDKEMVKTQSFFELFDEAKDLSVECINDLYRHIFLNESFDVDKYFKDLSYITGVPCSYDLEMKYFDNIFKK